MDQTNKLLGDISTTENVQIFLMSMINSVPGFVTVVDEKGTYLMANKRLLEKIGITLENFLGASLGFAENNSEFRFELEKFLGDKSQVHFSDIKLLKFRVNDEARWHLLSFTKIPELGVTICSSIDTHEEIALNLEINRQREIIESNGKLALLGEMAGGIAHEINNPMATIDLHVERMRRLVTKEPIPKEEIAKSLDIIESTVDRTVKIVRSLKSFARNSEADKPQATSLQKIIEAVSVLEVDRFKQKNVPLEIDPVPDVMLECRETEICQVLVNLINNGLDAIAENKVRWVRVSFHDEPDDIEIRVTDSGEGIPKEVEDKMMNPFFTTKEVGKGTGLGLSLSRRFIENHAGRMYYNRNWPNTQFVITLPKLQLMKAAA